MKSLFVNPKAVLFHDALDKRNKYHTIVCNPKTETYLKINPSGYRILRTIEESPDITVAEISKTIGIKEETIKKFILTMRQENVIIDR